MALTTKDVIYGAPLSKTESIWTVRAIRVVLGWDVTTAFMTPVSYEEHTLLEGWMDTLHGGFETEPPRGDVCQTLYGILLKNISTPSVSLGQHDLDAISRALVKLNCMKPVRWTHREIRMVRYAINLWRESEGFLKVDDAETQSWIASRSGEGLPSEEEVCEILEHSGYSISDVTKLQDKLGCPSVPVVEKEEQPPSPPTPTPAPAPKSPVQAALSPFEASLVTWMFEKGWHTDREAAVAHVIRLREAGVIDEWKRRGKKGLSGAEMIETLARYKEHTSMKRKMVLKKRGHGLEGLGSTPQGHIDTALRIIDQANRLVEKNTDRWVACPIALKIYDQLRGLISGIEENLGEVPETPPDAVIENIDFLTHSLSTLQVALDTCFQPGGAIGLWLRQTEPGSEPTPTLHGLEALKCACR